MKFRPRYFEGLLFENVVMCFGLTAGDQQRSVRMFFYLVSSIGEDLELTLSTNWQLHVSQGDWGARKG